jgi:hypothetical protein
MHKCQACRRPLTNPISISQGLGPDCLRRAVKAGTAPLEALEVLTAYQRSTAKQKAKRTKQPAQLKHVCIKTPDLFDFARQAAITALQAAIEECRRYGLTINYTIENEQ